MMDNTVLFDHMLSAIKKYIAEAKTPGQPVVNYTEPDALASEITIPVAESGLSTDELGSLMHQYLSWSANTGNPQFMNQLFSGINIPAIAGDMLSTVNNTSMYTYEVAPVATLVEKEMIRMMCGYAGYTGGDGIFLTGGSNANLIAMFSARNRLFPDSRFHGIAQSRVLTAFVSADAHYSFGNAANLMSLGSKNLHKIPVDAHGRMIPEKLEEAIIASQHRGELPFFIGATLGTTVRASFDLLEPLALLARKYNLWLHADGAFGGSLILSPDNQHLFKGLELTDSFAWDTHKLMNVPLISSVLLVKQRGTLQYNLSDIDTGYIYHDNSAIEDLGKKSIQCGRRVDAVKLWFAWKFYGKEGYRQRIENLMTLAAYAEEHVNRSEKLEMVVPRETVTVCFRYIPKPGTDSNDFNFMVRETLRKSGQSIVNMAWINKTRVIRLIISNSETTKEDVDRFFDQFLATAKELEK